MVNVAHFLPHRNGASVWMSWAVPAPCTHPLWAQVLSLQTTNKYIHHLIRTVVVFIWVFSFACLGLVVDTLIHRCLSCSDPQDTDMVSWSHHERGSPQNDHSTRPSRRVRTTIWVWKGLEARLGSFGLMWCYLMLNVAHVKCSRKLLESEVKNMKNRDITAAKTSLNL